MRQTAPFFIVALLVGCTSKAEHPATRPATQPVLHSIDLHFGLYLQRFDDRTTITADGLLRSLRTQNKSYGPKDLDPKYERIEIREGRLTPQQMSELAALFANWDSLSSERYGGVPDGGDIEIRYGDKIVRGGSAVPAAVRAVQTRISDLGRAMPVVK